MELPEGFQWINKPVTVIGEDFTYEATCLCSFPKSNGKVRYIVEDRGRLFIQRESQLKWPQDPEPSQTIGEALELHHERTSRPSPSGSGCPHCGHFHPPDGVCI